VSTKGSQPLDERVTNLQDCHPPKTASQLRRFPGMVNSYRRFLPHTGTTARRSVRPQTHGLRPHHLDTGAPQGIR
jgi:hypothetical protein